MTPGEGLAVSCLDVILDSFSNFENKSNPCKTWQTVSAAATMMWARRVLSDFMKKAPAKSPVKQKDPWEYVGTKHDTAVRFPKKIQHLMLGQAHRQ